MDDVEFLVDVTVRATRDQGRLPAVIERLKTEALAEGRRFELGVGKDNPRARALYERLGFVATGEDGDEIRMRWVESRG